MFPSWVLIAIVGYMSMALSQLLDKALLNVAFKEAKSFVFLIALFNLLAFVLLPFGVELISLSNLLISLLAGALFILALIPFLSALQGDDASRVIPLVGGLIPIATLIGEVLFLDATFVRNDLLAFALLVIGSIVLTFTKSSSPRRSWSSVIKAIIGSILFAASFVLTKYVFDITSFVNGFFWMRMGGILVAIGLLFHPDVLKGLKHFFKTNSKLVQSGYFATQGLNGFGFVLQSYAISLANVSLVNALQGAQYLFIIVFVAVAAKFKPDLLGEKITVGVIVEKLTAVVIIVTGIALLAL
jgi:drug/metabolite transporter (DMT)-like permease